MGVNSTSDHLPWRGSEVVCVCVCVCVLLMASYVCGVCSRSAVSSCEDCHEREASCDAAGRCDEGMETSATVEAMRGSH